MTNVEYARHFCESDWIKSLVWRGDEACHLVALVSLDGILVLRCHHHYYDWWVDVWWMHHCHWLLMFFASCSCAHHDVNVMMRRGRL